MNIIIPFTLNEAEVKGRIIKLNDALDIILNQHQYPDVIARILGELLLVVSLIGSQFKDEVLLTIQLQMKDKKQYIIADYQSPGFIRGYAQFDKEQHEESYEGMINDTLLMVTIDRKNNQRYQGIVDIKDRSISEALEQYFYQSEQINTSLKLKIGKVTLPQKQESWCGGGIMIQRLPLKEDEDSWNEAKLFFSTLRDDELLDPDLALETLLYSVYNEMNVKVYEALEIEHRCRCSRERVEQVLESLGFEEVISMMIDKKIAVDCQFCNKSQDFVEDDIKRIFKEHI